MSLTIKQENFCLAYIETGDATESYRRAYDAENMSTKVIGNKASELLKNGEIRVKIENLRKPVIERAQLTLEEHIADLKRLRDDAWASEKYGPAIQAEIARGKASGHYIERVEKGNPGDFDKLTDEQLLQRFNDVSSKIDVLSKSKDVILKAKSAAKA